MSCAYFFQMVGQEIPWVGRRGLVGLFVHNTTRAKRCKEEKAKVRKAYQGRPGESRKKDLQVFQESYEKG